MAFTFQRTFYDPLTHSTTRAEALRGEATRQAFIVLLLTQPDTRQVLCAIPDDQLLVLDAGSLKLNPAVARVVCDYVQVLFGACYRWIDEELARHYVAGVYAAAVGGTVIAAPPVISLIQAAPGPLPPALLGRETRTKAAIFTRNVSWWWECYMCGTSLRQLRKQYLHDQFQADHGKYDARYLLTKALSDTSHRLGIDLSSISRAKISP